MREALDQRRALVLGSDLDDVEAFLQSRFQEPWRATMMRSLYSAGNMSPV